MIFHFFSIIHSNLVIFNDVSTYMYSSMIITINNPFQNHLAFDPCFESGQCIESFQLDAEFSSDEYDCLDLCTSNEQCSWFTHLPKLNLCQMLSNCSAIDADRCPDCLTGKTGELNCNKMLKKRLEKHVCLSRFR